jgi:hypothetical protein
MWKFTWGRTEIHDIHRSGKSSIDHIDEGIVFLLPTFPFHIVRTLAEILNISPDRMLHHVRHSLGFKLYHFRWIPHELISHLKEKRVVMCGELLERLQMEEIFGFARVVTGDESWLYLNGSHTHIWLVSDRERPVRVDQTIASEKHILAVLWSFKAR